MKKFIGFLASILVVALIGVLVFILVFDKEDVEETKGATVSVSGVYNLTLNPGTTLLGLENEVTTFQGVNGATLKAVGSEKGCIQAYPGGSLIFKDLTIVDATDDVYTDLYGSYLRLGGKLRFENCAFMQPIYLTNDVNVDFINCSFRSERDNYYSVWVADGDATFESCKFVGPRALKINEFTGEDVKTVYVNNCEFSNIHQTPGVCIGQFLTNLGNTKIKLTNNTFKFCAGVPDGAISGVDGFFTSDTALGGITFVERNNTVLYEELVPATPGSGNYT